MAAGRGMRSSEFFLSMQKKVFAKLRSFFLRHLSRSKGAERGKVFSPQKSFFSLSGGPALRPARSFYLSVRDCRAARPVSATDWGPTAGELTKTAERSVMSEKKAIAKKTRESRRAPMPQQRPPPPPPLHRPGAPSVHLDSHANAMLTSASFPCVDRTLPQNANNRLVSRFFSGKRDATPPSQIPNFSATSL